jgi:hypothetical protein
MLVSYTENFKMVSHIKGRKQADDFREQGADKDIWM